ncbi:MAG TPA: type I-E CRISPR-associated endonuclease Cas1e [Nevskiaceae bacterium]|nr:type I-E CRISPR-associated endonuclease Cas1e [Nevskiaceae bacterium]
MIGDIHHPGSVPLRSRATFVALDHGTLRAAGYSLVLDRETGDVIVPVGSTTVLMLEPGVSVTHAAVKLCADQGTLLIWVGEAGVHVYASGRHPRAAAHVLKQASLRLNSYARMRVVRRLYERMFGEAPPASKDVEPLRGVEGSRVKRWYADLAAAAGVPWTTREAAPPDLRSAIGYATSTLYGLSEAVILAAGFSPEIGFIHTGDPRSLVFDLADTVKFRTVMPEAFAAYASGATDIRSAVRRRCRDRFRAERTIDALFDNLSFALTES